MAEPVRARRLSDEEGRRLQQIVRGGKHGSIRVRRAMIIMASRAWKESRDPDRDAKRPSGAGPSGRTSSCALRPRTRPGPIQ